MKIVLATGIYPPDIGGPATYVEKLAEGLSKAGNQVTVVTYGVVSGQWSVVSGDVVRVSRAGGPILRWFRYARALRRYGADSDAVVAFSSVSVGVPLVLARLKKPKKILRLGGEFFWERYTGMGGTLGLREWYAANPLRLTRLLNTACMEALLQSFDHLVYSTAFQEESHASVYPALPPHSVIENAVPEGTPTEHQPHEPFRLLSFGRLVGFKNLPSLLRVSVGLPGATLTIVGEGPLRGTLSLLAQRLGITDRVRFLPPALGELKQRIFAEQDLLVIPSVTEISPNTALEARSSGLPVLLTEETGLSALLADGMTLAPLRTPEQISKAIGRVVGDYPRKAHAAAEPLPSRGWAAVTSEFLRLLRQLLALSSHGNAAAFKPDMRLLMISGDRSILSGKKGAFWYTLEELSKHFERIDVVCPRAPTPNHPSPLTLNPSPDGRGTPALPSPLGRRVGDEGVSAERGENKFFPNVHFHSSPHRLWYQPFWIKKCGAQLINEFGHEVMTVHDYPPFYNGIGARKLLRRFKLRSVLEIHHIAGWPRAASVFEFFACVLSRLFLPAHARRFDAVRTVSRSIGEELKRWGIPPEKMRIVPSFYLDRELLRPDPSIRKQYDLVFSGRLVPNKGLPSLLRALTGLPGVSLLVIGDGPERVEMERLTQKLGLSGRVRFSGWLPDQQAVIRAMQMARVFVLPSLSEGGPRIALEAMALGLPVIATWVGVLPEVIVDGVNGIVTTGESSDLVSKIGSLLRDEGKRAAIGKEALRILEKFERVRLIKGYAEFLKGQ